MKKLGDLVLPESLQWKNQFSWAPVVQETARTLGGSNVVWASALSGGRPIDLEAAEDVTWLSLEVVRAIQAMAAQAGAVFTLVWDEDAYAVMFRHQDAPAVSLNPIYPHSQLFAGTIKLIEV